MCYTMAIIKHSQDSIGMAPPQDWRNRPGQPRALGVPPVYFVLPVTKALTALPLVALFRTLVANEQPGRPMK